MAEAEQNRELPARSKKSARRKQKRASAPAASQGPEAADTPSTVKKISAKKHKRRKSAPQAQSQQATEGVTESCGAVAAPAVSHDTQGITAAQPDSVPVPAGSKQQHAPGPVQQAEATALARDQDAAASCVSEAADAVADNAQEAPQTSEPAVPAAEAPAVATADTEAAAASGDESEPEEEMSFAELFLRMAAQHFAAKRAEQRAAEDNAASVQPSSAGAAPAQTENAPNVQTRSAQRAQEAAAAAAAAAAAPTPDASQPSRDKAGVAGKHPSLAQQTAEDVSNNDATVAAPDGAAVAAGTSSALLHTGAFGGVRATHAATAAGGSSLQQQAQEDADTEEDDPLAAFFRAGPAPQEAPAEQLIGAPSVADRFAQALAAANAATGAQEQAAFAAPVDAAGNLDASVLEQLGGLTSLEALVQARPNSQQPAAAKVRVAGKRKETPDKIVKKARKHEAPPTVQRSGITATVARSPQQLYNTSGTTQSAKAYLQQMGQKHKRVKAT